MFCGGGGGGGGGLTTVESDSTTEKYLGGLYLFLFPKLTTEYSEAMQWVAGQMVAC